MTKLRARTLLWLGLLLVILPCLALALVSYYQAARIAPELEQSRVLVGHTFDVLRTAQALDAAMQDAERGQRGFLITGDEAYLAPYQRGIEIAPGLLAKIQTLTQDNPEQQRKLPILKNLIDTKLAELARTIEARKRDGFDAARQIVLTNVGSDAMRAIITLIDTFVATEDALLTERLARTSEIEIRNKTAAVVTGVLALISMALGVTTVLMAFRNVQTSQEGRRTAEERLGQFVRGVTEYAIYTLDPKGFVTTWNQGAARLKGYTADEIIGQHVARFYTSDDKKNEVWNEALATAARDGMFETEAWRVRKDGTRFMAHVVINPVRDTAGDIIGFSKITQDITARIRQQKALQEAQAAFAQSQKMESLGQLTGGVAHDFNNMLMVIKSAAGLLRRRLTTEDQDVMRFVDAIDQGTDRAASLTQRLLAFSRRQTLEPKTIEPNKLIAGLADFLRRSLGETVTLETALAAGVWNVAIDFNQLESAILNLAINARDAMPQGGKLTIETGNASLDEAYANAHEEVKPGQYIMIAVSDTGVGMIKESLARAFEPFYTTKEIGKGTGLGLSQVYGFIKQSGGHIKLYSEPRGGTTVKLYLPRLYATDDALARSLPVPKVVASGNEGAAILLVEDDEQVRSFTAEMLAALGYRVMLASNGQEALQTLTQNDHINLLFTDVGLPDGMNGRQLAEEARRLKPSLKVLFTTGYARNAIVHHGRLDPGVELILKPFTEADVAQKIHEILDKGNSPLQ
jgi:PAS domain S-box-containing protein